VLAGPTDVPAARRAAGSVTTVLAGPDLARWAGLAG
jgi:hypothetical protein